jgi:hypothetical protein
MKAKLSMVLELPNGIEIEMDEGSKAALVFALGQMGFTNITVEAIA